MDSAVLGILAIIIGGVIFILFVRSRSKDDEEISDIHYTPGPPHPPMPAPSERILPHRPATNRVFTLAELKRAEAGRYNWDESGCVFEINSDGSVTVVGSFDPAELRIDPVQEMFERLNNEGLIEMLPKIWSFHIVTPHAFRGNVELFIIANNNDFLSSRPPSSIDDVKDTSLILSAHIKEKTDILHMLSTVGDGYLTLMPSNEKEYILSLGAKACVERAFGDKVRVRISSPAVMGAFGIGATRATNKTSKISFAFGEGEDYMCCNLLAEDGVFEVKELLRSSIIQPAETYTALQHIAQGCMIQSLIREGWVKDHLLLNMIPYTMTLLLKEDDRVIKIYDCISEPVSIPTSQGEKEVNIDAHKSLSLLIGSYELIEDIMAECNAPNGKVGAFIELDANMDVEVKITSQYNDYVIKVGQLIG